MAPKTPTQEGQGPKTSQEVGYDEADPDQGRDRRIREFEYQYQFDPLDKVWHFVVEAIPRPTSMEIFTMTFKPINEKTVRQTSIMHNHDPAYAAIGRGRPLAPSSPR